MNDADIGFLTFLFGFCYTLFLMEFCRCDCPKGRANPGPIGIILWPVVETVRLFEKIFAWAMRRYPLMTIFLLFVACFVAMCGFTTASIIMLVICIIALS